LKKQSKIFFPKAEHQMTFLNFQVIFKEDPKPILLKPNQIFIFYYDQLKITLMEKLNQCIMQGQVNMGLIDDVWLQKQTSNHLVNLPRPPVYK